MALLSAVTIAAVWAVARPVQVVRKARQLHAATVVLIGRVELRLQRFRSACGLERGR
jgi:competence protein ComEC